MDAKWRMRCCGLVLLLVLPLLARAQCPPKAALNGHRLTAKEAHWLAYVADTIAPRLAGYAADRCDDVCATHGCSGSCLLDVATWWALKEGSFDPPGRNPFRQSLCHRRRPACAHLTCAQIEARKKAKPGKQPGVEPLRCFADVPLSQPTAVCPSDPCLRSTPWQVGLAGVQVPDFTDADVEAIVAALGTTDDALLHEAAGLAAYAPGDPRYEAIVQSSGVLKRSWLLRHPLIGLLLVARTAGAQCIDGSASWCYGRGWDQSRWFAPTRADALATIESGLPALLASCAGATTSSTATTTTTDTSTTAAVTTTTTIPADVTCCCNFEIADEMWHCVHGSGPGLCAVPWPDCCSQPYTVCP